MAVVCVQHRADLLGSALDVGDHQTVQTEGSLVDVGQAQAQLLHHPHDSALIFHDDLILALDARAKGNLDVNRAHQELLYEHWIRSSIDIIVAPGVRRFLGEEWNARTVIARG